MQTVKCEIHKSLKNTRVFLTKPSAMNIVFGYYRVSVVLNFIHKYVLLFYSCVPQGLYCDRLRLEKAMHILVDDVM